MAIQVKYDVFLKKLRESDVGVFAGAIWEELGGNAYRLTGNVGIGIDVPQEKLHVHGTVLAFLFKRIINLANGLGILIEKNPIVAAYIILYKNIGGNYIGGIRLGSSPGYYQLLSGDEADPENLVQTVNITPTGEVGIKSMPVDADFHVHGFTKLGDHSSAPPIKMKFISGLTNIDVSVYTSYNHGIADINDILHVSALMDMTALLPASHVPPNSTVPSFQEYEIDIIDTYIRVKGVVGNRSAIGGRNVKIAITYRET